MLRQRVTGVVWVAALACAAPAAAQTVASDLRADQTQTQKPRPPAPARPAARRDPIGFRAYVNFDYLAIAAKESFDAVLGTSSMSAVGGGGEVLNLWKGLFARVGVSSASDTGSRVAVVNNEVFDLDIPIDIKMTMLEFAGGWRYAPRPRPRAPAPGRPVVTRPLAAPQPRYAVYGGGGLLRVSYHEDSQFAGSLENVRDTFNGYLVFGGIEVTVWKWVIAGVEGQYRGINNALGDGGVSEVFGEKNLGGGALRVLFGVRK
jgi:hypothetical protein